MPGIKTRLIFRGKKIYGWQASEAFRSATKHLKWGLVERKGKYPKDLFLDYAIGPDPWYGNRLVPVASGEVSFRTFSAHRKCLDGNGLIVELQPLEKEGIYERIEVFLYHKSRGDDVHLSENLQDFPGDARRDVEALLVSFGEKVLDF